MTSTPRDYYDVLGVEKTASAADLKKAYRRLARKYHPDLHSGPQKAEMGKKFKELNEAYEVLGDEATRKKYDQYGLQWKDAEAYQRAKEQARARGASSGWETYSTQGEGADFNDLFSELFGRQAKREGPSFRGFAMPGADLETTIQLPLRDFLSDTTQRLELTDATGTPHIIEVRIPKGVKDGERLRVKGKGASGRGGGPAGDLYLRIHALPHPVFQQQGIHLLVTLPIWPWEAALGTEVEVPTLTGPVRLKIPPKSQSKQKMRLRGKGLPSRGEKHGDQIVILDIIIPSEMTSHEQQLYEQLKNIAHSDPRAHLIKEATHA
ncbi:MAG: molecular chaperone DnaJ [Nitrospirales bacterium]|nr:MAG: molecular chaperone DnaJ [Nitrospirales bacterium]